MSKEYLGSENEKPETIEIQEDGKTEDTQDTKAGFNDYLRIFAFSDGIDWTLNGIGALAAIASGCSLAL